jgi:pantothenate kinase type III
VRGSSQRRGGLLTVDRGNSTFDLRFDPSTDGPQERARFDRERLPAVLEWLAARPVARCHAASVVRGGLDDLRAALRSRGVEMLVAGEELPCPLTIRYDDPRELGVDRWLAAIAAHAVHGTAAIVDCGTATTFGVVRRDGALFPGPIAPGLDALAVGLAIRAPGLPHFDLGRSWQFPPRGTQDAIAAGVLLCAAAAVDGILSRLFDALRERGELDAEPTVLVTGGRAEPIAANLRRTVALAPDLVHDGLAWLTSP